MFDAKKNRIKCGIYQKSVVVLPANIPLLCRGRLKNEVEPFIASLSYVMPWREPDYPSFIACRRERRCSQTHAMGDDEGRKLQ